LRFLPLPCLLLVCATSVSIPRVEAQTQDRNAGDVFELRAGAWDRSVQLEREGRIEQARSLLLRAWGPSPESYDVTVRLGWLSLRLDQSEQACAYYRRARSMPGVGPEASQGLSTALAAMGHSKLENFDRGQAERLFQEAIVADPSNESARQGLQQARSVASLEPEIWGAYVRKPDEGAAWNGWALFGHLPWHVTSALTFRGAFRHVELTREVRGARSLQTGVSGSRGAVQTERWYQNELYAGVDWERRWVGFEALGIGLWPSDEAAAWGGGGRARLGWTAGLNLQGSAIRRDSGWNGQLLPTAFWWPWRSVGLAAGPRFTADSVGSAISAFGGVTLKLGAVSTFVSGHAGTERWPVTMAVPSVLTLDQDLRFGATAAAMVSLSESVRLGVHGQIEQIALAGTQATYATVSAGIQLAPKF
jgi:hypothetical protein